MEKKHNRSLRNRFKKLVHNPWIDFSVGIILALSGLLEAIDTFPKEMSDFKLGAHHGVLVLGLATIMRALASMFAGLEFIDEGEYVEKQQREGK